MDPDVALENMRKAVEELVKALPPRRSVQVAELVEAWDALDGWMSQGNFRPAAWKP